MKKWLEGYKVVQWVGAGYVSFICNALDGSLRYKRYGIGKVTKRTHGDGPLAVFVKLEDAVAFINLAGGPGYDNRVCSCRYVKSRNSTYWQKTKDDGKTSTSGAGIAGKAFADEVELVEEVN